ncbi:MAG: hypothetical protein ACLQD8_00600 [Thermoplasmata archaeon]
MEGRGPSPSGEPDSTPLVALGTAVLGAILLGVGGLAISIVNRLPRPILTSLPLAAIELSGMGAILLSLGFVGLVQRLRGVLGDICRIVGLVLGVVLTVGIAFWEVIAPAPSPLTGEGITIVFFVGLAFFGTVLYSFMIPEPASPTDGSAPKPPGADPPPA